MENQKLIEFLQACETDKNFTKIEKYQNLLTITFNEAIHSPLMNVLKLLPNDYFIACGFDYQENRYMLKLFIYYIKNFDNEK